MNFADLQNVLSQTMIHALVSYFVEILEFRINRPFNVSGKLSFRKASFIQIASHLHYSSVEIKNTASDTNLRRLANTAETNEHSKAWQIAFQGRYRMLDVKLLKFIRSFEKRSGVRCEEHFR